MQQVSSIPRGPPAALLEQGMLLHLLSTCLMLCARLVLELSLSWWGRGACQYPLEGLDHLTGSMSA